MDLNQFLKRHPLVRSALPSDNSRILDFYNQTSMAGESVQIRSIRDPDFFKLLHLQATQNFVFLGENASGRIVAIGILSLRTGWIQGEKTTVGYLGDLRIGFDRQIIRAWRKFYSDLLENAHKISEFQGCQYFLTAVIDGNHKAERALIAQRKAGFQYTPIEHYRMVNILRRWGKLFRSKSKDWHVTRASSFDFSDIQHFLSIENSRKPFGFDFSGGELERRLTFWPDFRIESFLIARDQTGKIVGCLAPWSPSSAKFNLVEKIPKYFSFLKLIVNIPKQGDRLNTLYLTHLEVSSELSLEKRQMIFRSLVDSLYQTGEQKFYHMVSFCDFESNPLRAALSGYWTYDVPMTFYQVSSSQKIHPAILRGPVGFEMSVI